MRKIKDGVRIAMAESPDGLAGIFAESKDGELFLLGIGESMTNEIPFRFCPVCGSPLRPVERDGYLSVTRAADSDSVVFEIRSRGSRQNITASLEDFAKVITGQLVSVEIEEKPKFR